MSNNYITAKKYENDLSIDSRKTKGIYYTSENIVKHIVKDILDSHDIVRYPYPKIIDISCGCGNFIIEAYDQLFDMFSKNLENIKIDGKKMEYNQIHYHIIKNCIYGIDIDENALKILRGILDIKFNEYEKLEYNIFNEDALKYDYNGEKFDYIIGNPPYIGHKCLENEYKDYLKEKYSEVYKDKSDIYFCFYKKAIDLLSDNGLCSLITPRYFIESISAISLKKYMLDNIGIYKVIDFLGANVFKNIGISSCILFLNKNIMNKYIDVYRIKNEDLNIYDICNIKDIICGDEFERFDITKEEFCIKGIMLNDCERKIFDRINEKSSFKLNDIVVSFQGIITGCDKAFIMDNSIDTYDDSFIKRWVKNRHIHKYIIEESNKSLIYADEINDKDHYLVQSIISKYELKLRSRRECRLNKRTWYHLQWGRDKSLFERKKIMYPYKSNKNRFAIDYKNCFSSADVYSFYIKEEYESDFSYEYLVGLLNSDIYETYYKLIAKKMSKGIYDYYPNKVLEIPIFKDDNYKKIESRVHLIYEEYENDNIGKIKEIQNEINELIMKSLHI